MIIVAVVAGAASLLDFNGQGYDMASFFLPFFSQPGGVWLWVTRPSDSVYISIEKEEKKNRVQDIFFLAQRSQQPEPTAYVKTYTQCACAPLVFTSYVRAIARFVTGVQRNF